MAGNYPTEQLNLVQQWAHRHHLPTIAPSLLYAALTHPSYKGLFPTAKDYERLEFLGDAVLDLITAESVFIDTQPTRSDEGDLTERRINKVNNTSLARIFGCLDLEPLIFTAVKYRLTQKDRANIIESIIGAIFISQGYEAAKRVWAEFLHASSKETKKISLNPEESQSLNLKTTKSTSAIGQRYFHRLGLVLKNAKSLLQELCQKQGFDLPKYTVLEKIGPDHAPLFRVQVQGILFQEHPDKVYDAQATAENRKLAEKKAAEALCDQIGLPYRHFS